MFSLFTTITNAENALKKLTLPISTFSAIARQKIKQLALNFVCWLLASSSITRSFFRYIFINWFISFLENRNFGFLVTIQIFWKSKISASKSAQFYAFCHLLFAFYFIALLFISSWKLTVLRSHQKRPRYTPPFLTYSTS